MFKKLALFLALSLAAQSFGATNRLIQANGIDGVATAQNLVPNANFESGLGGWTALNGASLTTSSSNDIGGNTIGFLSTTFNGVVLDSPQTAIPSYLKGTIGTLSCLVGCGSGGTVTNFKMYPYQVSGTAWGGTAYQAALQCNSTAYQRVTISNIIFPVSGNLGIEFSHTGTSTDNVNFGRCYLGGTDAPGGSSTGYNGSDTSTSVNVTPDPTAFGAVAGLVTSGHRAGDRWNVDVAFTTGTVGAATAAVTLPAGYTIDTTKLGNKPLALSAGSIQIAGAARAIWSSADGLIAFYDGSTNNQIFITNQDGANTFTKQNGNAFIGNSQNISFHFSIPVAGWSSNAPVVPSDTYWMSAYLVNGTRVTGTAPAKLGEYRTYLRNASALTYTETGGTPTTLPTSADGIKMWTGGAWASADTTNQPTQYDIFIGKNKVWRLQVYGTTGRTGQILSDYFFNSPYSTGLRSTYDPTTGVLTVIQPVASSGTTVRACGYDNVMNNLITNCYFDVQVSNNVNLLNAAGPRSTVLVNFGNGYGSTNTGVRRWTTIQKNVGTDITYADSATLGGSFTINTTGLYAMSFSQRGYSSAGTPLPYISLNASTLTSGTVSGSITGATAVVSASELVSTGYSLIYPLNAGDVIRMQEGSAVSADNISTDFFLITRVAN